MNNAVSEVKKPSLIAAFGSRYGVDEGRVLSTLKATAFKQSGNKQITDEQMISLLVVANEYELNPFTKEIYAFEANGGIVPIVSIDGWMKIINSHPDMDGMEFDDVVVDGKVQSITCSIYRKGRAKPTTVTEYMAECARNTQPWKQWSARMLRHKAAIQCARYAFGFSGISDPDEAERIVEAQAERQVEGEVIPSNSALDVREKTPPTYSDEDFAKHFPDWEKRISASQMSAEQLIATVESRAPLTPEQKDKIMSIEVII